MKLNFAVRIFISFRYMTNSEFVRNRIEQERIRVAVLNTLSYLDFED